MGGIRNHEVLAFKGKTTETRKKSVTIIKHYTRKRGKAQRGKGTRRGEGEGSINHTCLRRGRV